MMCACHAWDVFGSSAPTVDGDDAAVSINCGAQAAGCLYGAAKSARMPNVRIARSRSLGPLVETVE